MQPVIKPESKPEFDLAFEPEPEFERAFELEPKPEPEPELASKLELISSLAFKMEPEPKPNLEPEPKLELAFELEPELEPELASKLELMSSSSQTHAPVNSTERRTSTGARKGLIQSMTASMSNYKLNILVRDSPNSDILTWTREKDWARIRCHYAAHNDRSDKSIQIEMISILETDKRGRRAIHWCCVHVAPFDVFLYLLRRGGPRSLSRDATGMSPLHLLCLSRAPLTFIREIIEKGNERDVWLENKKKQSPLDLACQARAPYDVICYLMDLRGEIPFLLKAISEKDWQEVERYLTDPSLPLLSRSYSTVTIDKYFPDSNFLHWACIFGAPISTFKLLLDKGVYPNKMDENKRTPLHLACYKKLDIDIVDIFIEVSGDDFLEMDNEGLTPLIAAFVFNHTTQNLSVIDRLLTKMKSDFSQLYYSVIEQDWKEVGKYLSDEDVSETEKKTSVCFRDIYSKRPDRNPLHWACRYGAPTDIIHLLIKYSNKYSVSYADMINRTPLHIACQRNAPLEVIKALVQVTESNILTFMDKAGLTPLANACVSGASEEIIEYLLKCGGLEDSLRLKFNKKDNLLDILLYKPTPVRIVEFIQQKWIEIDPHMTSIPNKTVMKSLISAIRGNCYTVKDSRDTSYCFKGKFIQMILNEHFIRKDVLTILMTDFYVQIILVTILSNELISLPFRVLLMICESWILFRECLQIFTTPFKFYALDFWNYLDLIQIYSVGMYINSIMGNEVVRTNGNEFLVHGVVWLGLIGVLKTMNYRIGIFVNALVEVRKNSLE